MSKIEFSPFEIDLDLMTLSESGRTIKIGAKAFDLLLCLIEHRDQVVDRRLLLDVVWKSAAISDATIPTAILEIRKALGDDAKSPRYIASIRGRGYRFLPEISATGHRRRRDSLPHLDFPFSGRRSELVVLQKCLRATASESRGHLVLIQGEAGIGKTRLTEEFLSTLTPDVPRAIAHCPSWTNVCRSDLWSQLSGQHLDCEQSDPPTSPTRTTQLTSPAENLTSQEKHRTRERGEETEWAANFAKLKRGQASVIVIEDVHQADQQTRRLIQGLTYAFTFYPVMVIATYRATGEALVEIEEFFRDAASQKTIRIDLGPMDCREIERLIDPLTSDRQAMATAIAEKTSGNPFYATEIIRHIEKMPSRPDVEAAIASYASGSRSALVRILSNLPDRTRETLEAASVLGATFCPQVLSQTLETDPNQIIEDLEPAVASAQLRSEVPLYCFRHQILRDALYASIPTPRRTALHYKFAQTLLARQPPHPPSKSLATISDHLFYSMPIATPHDVCVSSLCAGESMDASEALPYLERALSTVTSGSSASITERCRVAVSLGRAYFRTGHKEQSRSLLLDACRLARDQGTPETFANCTLSLMTDYQEIEVGTYDLTVTRLVEEAIENSHKLDSALRAKLHASLALCLRWSGEVDAHTRAADASLDLARSTGNTDALKLALSAKSETLHGPDRTSHRIKILKDSLHLARSFFDMPYELLQHTRMLTALLELGNITAVDAENLACREKAEATGLPELLWYPDSADSMRSLMTGDCSENYALRARYQEIQTRGKDANVAQGYATQEAFRQIELGNISAVRPLIEDMAHQHPLVLGWRAASAWIAWASGDLASSRMILDSLNPGMLESMFREPGGASGIALLAEVASQIGRNSLKKKLYQMIHPVVERAATAGYGALYLGSFARYSGLLAISLAQYENAIDQLRLAITHETSRGATLWKAYAEIDLLAAMLDSGSSQCETEIAHHDAAQTTTALGLPRVSSRLDELAARQ